MLFHEEQTFLDRIRHPYTHFHFHLFPSNLNNFYQCAWQLNNQQQQQLISNFNYNNERQLIFMKKSEAFCIFSGVMAFVLEFIDTR